MVGEGLDAGRPDGSGDLGARPIGGGGLVERRVQIVAEGRGQRRLIALACLDPVQRGRMLALALHQQLGEAARLGLQPAETILGGAGRGAGLGLGAGAVAAVCLGGLDRRTGGRQFGLGRGQSRLRGLDFGRLQRAQRRALGLGRGQLRLRPGHAGLGVALAGAFGVDPGLDRGRGAGDALDLGVGGLARVLGGGEGGFQLGTARRGPGDLCGQGLQRRAQPGQFVRGVAGHGRLALDIGGDAGGLGGQAVDLRPGGLFRHVEPVALKAGAVQQGAGDGVLLAGGLQRLLRRQRRRLGPAGGGGRLAHGPLGVGQLLRRGLRGHAGVVPAYEQQGRLQGADLGGDLLVAFGLPRLALQPGQRRLELPPDVVQTVEVGLGRLEPQLGLVPARMQAGHAARLLEDAAAVLRLGGDQFADLALTHQRRAVGARRGVGEQQLDVAGADLLAVDAIGRAVAAVDAARHLQHRAVGEGLRRPALGVVDGQLDFGVVARRAVGGAGEDDVVHALAAHGLGRVGAHDPAQAFQHIGLAAAVGADDAGQARLDMHLGGIDEGLEAHEPEALELHGSLRGHWPAAAARIATSSPPSERSVTRRPLTKKDGVESTPAAMALSMSRLMAARVAGVAAQASIWAWVRPLTAMAGAYQSSRFPPRRTADWPCIRAAATSKKRSGAAHRASAAPGSDISSGSVGRLRNTNRTWPVSIKRALKTG